MVGCVKSSGSFLYVRVHFVVCWALHETSRPRCWLAMQPASRACHFFVKSPYL